MYVIVLLLFIYIGGSWSQNCQITEGPIELCFNGALTDNVEKIIQLTTSRNDSWIKTVEIDSSTFAGLGCITVGNQTCCEINYGSQYHCYNITTTMTTQSEIRCSILQRKCHKSNEAYLYLIIDLLKHERSIIILS